MLLKHHRTQYKKSHCCHKLEIIKKTETLFNGAVRNQGLVSRKCFRAEIRYKHNLGQFSVLKVRKTAKIRNRYNKVPHLTQDTDRKVPNSQLDITNESQEVSPFPAGDQKATIIRPAEKHNKPTT